MSYAEQDTGAVKLEESLFVFLSDFEPQFQRLAKVVRHIGGIADHVEGSRPQEAAAPSGQQLDSSMVAAARRRLERLRMLCSQLENETERMARAIGGLSPDKPPSTNRIAYRDVE